MPPIVVPIKRFITRGRAQMQQERAPACRQTAKCSHVLSERGGESHSLMPRRQARARTAATMAIPATAFDTKRGASVEITATWTRQGNSKKGRNGAGLAFSRSDAPRLHFFAAHGRSAALARARDTTRLRRVPGVALLFDAPLQAKDVANTAGKQWPAAPRLSWASRRAVTPSTPRSSGHSNSRQRYNGESTCDDTGTVSTN